MNPPPPLVGIVNLRKPTGLTSRAAVDRVLRFAKPAKVGHAGTLDPLAEGVLVICIGTATRFIEEIQAQDKGYDATFRLGCTSPTEDVDGEVTEIPDAPIPSRPELEAACGNFVGTILQRPPAFSAVKIAGKRAYDLARAGKAVETAPRPVRIDRLEILEYAYPTLRLRIVCGSGTYVRAIGRDLAESLGTGAVMSALIRTRIGGFRVEEALDADAIDHGSLLRHLRPIGDAVPDLPRFVLNVAQLARIRNGRPPEPAETAAWGACPRVLATTAEGEAAALLVRGPEGSWRIDKMLLT